MTEAAQPAAASAPAGHSTLPAYLALTGAALFWGGNWAIARWVQGQVPPQTLGLMRWGVAALMLTPFALPGLLRVWPAVRREWLRLTILGFVGVTGFSALTYTGLSYTTSINGALLNAAAPVFLIIFSAFGIGEKSGTAQVLGVAASLVGVIVIVARGSWESLAALSINPGDALVLLAVLLWAIYTVLLKRWPMALPPLVYLYATMVFSLPLPIATTIVELTVGSQMPAFNVVTIATFLYLGLFPSIGAYICWAYGVKRVGPTRATLFQYLIPVFAAGLAVVMLGESVRLFHIVGAALIIGGLIIAARPAR